MDSELQPAWGTGWKLTVDPTFAQEPEPPATRTRTLPSTWSPTRRGIVCFSGGSAANSLVDVFEEVRAANRTTLSYVIPISDNGGSSSELIRVFGGPGIGDVRSRLVRLIPEDTTEAVVMKQLFNHRLPKSYAPARVEWLDIIEANHVLWDGISAPKRELIRSVLNTVNTEIVKRLRPTSKFDFSGASIGNLFLTGARLFTGSFESAIYLLSSICGVASTVSVLPVLNTNFTHHIAVGLEDGSVIIGQNDISHPSEQGAVVPGIPASPRARFRSIPEDQDRVEDANLPGTLPTLRRPAIVFSKEHEEELPSRIERLWYINPYGQEIRLPANSRVIDAINDASCIIYSPGSLFTSLVPNFVLRGVGEAISSPLIRTKILILNSILDRETGPSHRPFTALDFVAAIANACNESRNMPRSTEYFHYVTHVVYLDGPSSPRVDRAALNAHGIETLRLYGPKAAEGKTGGYYDPKALGQALEALIGRADSRYDRTRRNTLIG